MPVIDADTHVDECEDTWKKLEGTPYAKYIPVTISMPPDEAKRAGYNPTNSRCWVVEVACKIAPSAMKSIIRRGRFASFRMFRDAWRTWTKWVSMYR